MEVTVLDSVLDVFGSIGEWFTGYIPTLFSLFWTPATADAPGSLTFLGVLACCGLAISVLFLCLGFIQRFLHFAG